jgi:thiamine kinase-like enzyme
LQSSTTQLKITKLFEKARDENESLLDFIKTVEKTDFIKRLEGDLEFIYLCIVKAFQSITNTNFTKKTILHYDFKHDNLMVDEKGKVHVLDFDFAHRGYVEFDLVKAAKYRATNKDETELNIEVFKQFIEAYKKHNPIVASMKELYGLLIYIILRRLIYAANYTIRGRSDLEFLYDKDIKLLNYLDSNKDMFANDK